MLLDSGGQVIVELETQFVSGKCESLGTSLMLMLTDSLLLVAIIKFKRRVKP